MDIIALQIMDYYKEECKKIKIYLERLGYSKETIRGYKNNLKYFFNWVCNANFYYIKDTNNIKKKKRTVKEKKLENSKIIIINQEILNKYNEYLHKKAIKRKTIQQKLNIIKLYDKYLQRVENRKIIMKPLEVLETELEIKPEILSQKEIKKIYKETEETLKGYLERAILALYYGCGLRSKEGLRLELKDINYETELIHIKPGKNYRNRYIPMSKQVKIDLLNYVKYSRKYLINNITNKLLINIQGREMRPGNTRNIIKRLAKSAGIEKRVTLHMLRHSIATHLLEQGMQLEQIAQFLGHKSIQTTQVYTHILNEKL
ncbi:MAG: tyrosine-type recombinase/integrase [Candidatus Thorarchaeota archaeon]